MSTKTEEPSTLELDAQFAEQITRARRTAEKIDRATEAARLEIRDADQAVTETLEAVMRGEPDAESAHEAALARRYAAVEQAARLNADESHAAALVVVRQAEARRKELREGFLPEFVIRVEEIVARATAAAERLGPALREYIDAYGEAAEAWRDLYPAVRSRLEADETQQGFYRSGESVIRDTTVPECPITASLLGRIAVAPRPPCMNPGFDGDPFRAAPAPSEGDTMPELVGEDGPILFGDPS